MANKKIYPDMTDVVTLQDTDWLPLARPGAATTDYRVSGAEIKTLATSGLGTASAANLGTSGASVPLCNSVNTWTGLQTIASLAQGVANVTAVAGAASTNAASGTVTSEALTAATTYTLTLTNTRIVATSGLSIIATNSASLPVTINSITRASGSVVIVLGMAALTGTVTIWFTVSN